MNIKFKKMFKTAIIFFTVFVMVFNSFAAISVSDGSAFVTKAEFSADLNNLSNRMSALENSIDAKIDSLVSSYLSRNGIWNGEKQTLAQTTETYALLNILGDGSSTTVKSYYHADNTDKLGTYATMDVQSLNLQDNRITNIGYIVNNISKTGLMCLTGQFYSSGSITDCAFFRTTGAYANDGSIVVGFNYRIISSSLSTVETGDIKTGEVDAATYQWGLNIMQNPAIYYRGNAAHWHLPKTKTISYFFVTKGEKLRAITQSYLKSLSTGFYRLRGNIVFEWESAYVY